MALARQNLVANQLTNVRVARLSAEEFSAAMEGVRTFARLDEAGVALPGDYTFSTLFVDPPRAGLDRVCPRLTRCAHLTRHCCTCVHASSLWRVVVHCVRGAGVCIDLCRGFVRILYISCNPATLARDVRALSATHAIERCAAFDQFPYTPHLECGVLLRRRVT